jgi:hypothetical protein
LQASLVAHGEWHAKYHPRSPWFLPSPVDDSQAVSIDSLADALAKLPGRKVTSHGGRAFFMLRSAALTGPAMGELPMKLATPPAEQRWHAFMAACLQTGRTARVQNCLGCLAGARVGNRCHQILRVDRSDISPPATNRITAHSDDFGHLIRN